MEVQEVYKSVKFNHTSMNLESITSSEVIHSRDHLQVSTPHGKDEVFLFLVHVGAGFFTLDVILEGRRIFPCHPSR